MTTMRWTIPASVALAALTAPAHAAVNDFRLPTEPVQPPTERQGPVAPDVPASRRPAPTPTPTAAPTSATPAPAVTPPVFVSPVTPPPPEPQPTARAAPEPVALSPAAASPVATPRANVSGATDSAGVAPSPATEPARAESQPAPPPRPPASAEAPDTEAPWWPRVLAVLTALAALGAGAWFWRQRKAAGTAATPAIERPSVAPGPEPAPLRGPVAAPPEPAPVPLPTPDPTPDRLPEPAAASRPAAAASPRPLPTLPQPAFAEPLQISLEPLRLSLTLMNATLAYRLQVANSGATALTGLTIGADMISAHASLSREEQLAGPSLAADRSGASVHLIERLGANESRVVEGEFRLPFQQIVPIRQGKAALLLPLARFRLETEGARPVVRTFLVGQPGASERLQPFRLDLGPRIYPHLAQHAFA